jgi:hypothetical protein
VNPLHQSFAASNNFYLAGTAPWYLNAGFFWPLTLYGSATNIGDAALGSGGTIRVYGAGVVGLQLLDPASSIWDPTAGAFPTGGIITTIDSVTPANDAHRVRLLVSLAASIQSLSSFHCPIYFRLVDNVSAETGNVPAWVEIPLIPGQDILAPDGKSIRITRSSQDCRNLGIFPATVTEPPGDAVSNEFFTADKNANQPTERGSSREDSDAIDATLGAVFTRRGLVRGLYHNTNPGPMRPIEEPFSTPFLKSAGHRYAEFAVDTNSHPFQSPTPPVAIQDQADLVYLSCHGSWAYGYLMNDQYSVVLTPTFMAGYPNAFIGNAWKEDVNTVVIMGCSVLDIGNHNHKKLGLLTSNPDPAESG